MVKYGRGLGREIYIAARDGEIDEPFSVADCRNHAKSRGWDVPETYMMVCLANGEANRDHSPTYKDFFVRVGDGMYKTNPNYTG